jgi:hypothetical protein
VKQSRYKKSESFKAGLVLESAVSDHLGKLGIAHRRTKQWGKEDVQDRLDLIVTPGGGKPAFEIQLTLRPKQRIKIYDFAHRSLTTAMRGIRLYIEVVGSHRRSADLIAVGRRVAESIQTIVYRFRDFGSANLMGVRIHAMTAKIEKFDLIDFCGRKLKHLIQVWQEQRRLFEERRREAAQQSRREHSLLPRVPAFWRTILDLPSPQIHALFPVKISPHIDTRPFFMPRRHRRGC